MKEVILKEMKRKSEKRKRDCVSISKNSLLFSSKIALEFAGIGYMNKNCLVLKMYEHENKIGFAVDEECKGNNFSFFKTNLKSCTSRIQSILVLRKIRKKYGIEENETCYFNHKVEMVEGKKMIFIWR